MALSAFLGLHVLGLCPLTRLCPRSPGDRNTSHQVQEVTEGREGWGEVGCDIIQQRPSLTDASELPGAGMTLQRCPSSRQRDGPLSLCMDQILAVAIPDKGVITSVQGGLQKGAQVWDPGPQPKGDLGGHHSVHSVWSGNSFCVQNRGHPFCSESPSHILSL